ncbi:M23 family metallopeptidase [Kordiimonas pumila]|uniref:M23 family metallopeptidase n=1 Tax=Kordiimonas pumila TaxID=2161677 RepID=A0ABV7D1C6_9PROT|nr:M23 family metallopeptidase [Kordiimonas pumila]
MPTRQQIYHWFSTQISAIRISSAFRRAVKASESPKGFLLIAAFGLMLLLVYKLPDGGTMDNGTGPLAEIAPDALAENESLLSIEEADGAYDTGIPTLESLKLNRNETLIGLLNRAGISNANANTAVIQLKKVTNLRKLRPGQEIKLIRNTDAPDTVAELRLRDSFSEEAVLVMGEEGYSATRTPFMTYGLTRFAEGEITDNLYMSAKREGVPDKVIIELIRMLSFDVDFEREIREGDHFEIYFERSFAPGFNDIEDGRILEAVLTLSNRTLEAFYFKDKNGDEDYFSADGKSTRRALMKTPLDVAVVTSSYGSRKHPVLGYTRMHKGVDFRAPTGTPIMAAGDGVIEMASRNGSYGNYIRIRHNGDYKTAYGHLSRYGTGVKKGKHVKQGQVIGYSGATGRVTAAHLHYEVLLNNKQVNPLTLKLPTGRTLKGEELMAFQGSRDVILAEIDQVRNMQLALASTADDTSPVGAASTAAR